MQTIEQETERVRLCQVWVVSEDDIVLAKCDCDVLEYAGAMKQSI